MAHINKKTVEGSGFFRCSLDDLYITKLLKRLLSGSGYPEIAFFSKLIFAIITVGFIVSIILFFIISIENEFFSRDLCFESECLESFSKIMAIPYSIAEGSVSVAVALTTIGGIYIALASYLSSISNAAFTNHIEHLKIFIDYLNSEIAKRDRLSPILFDSLLLYSTIFNQSRLGKTTVSAKFRNTIKKLNEKIEEANLRFEVGCTGGFDYKKHQRDVRDLLAEVGITLYLAPRNDYFDFEGQLFSLLNRLGQSFCPVGELPEISVRKYS